MAVAVAVAVAAAVFLRGNHPAGAVHISGYQPAGGTFQRPLVNDSLEIWRFAPGFLGHLGMEPVHLDEHLRERLVQAHYAGGDVRDRVRSASVCVEWGRGGVPADGRGRRCLLDGAGRPGPARELKGSYAGQVLDFGYAFNDLNRAKYFNIAEDIRQAKAFADARRDPREADAIPAVWVQPAATMTSTTRRSVRLT